MGSGTYACISLFLSNGILIIELEDKQVDIIIEETREVPNNNFFI
ncbi:hypothetical protein [Candidatus Arthromitus sp. SFB-mouse]|nr:hypothetical protein [Candidatus Arthromitus sp. SFB-mouse]